MRSPRTFCTITEFLIASAALLIIAAISSLVSMHFKSPSKQEPARVYRKQRRTSQMDTSKKNVGSDPSESDKSEFEEAPRQKKPRRRPKKSNATPSTRVLLCQYVVFIIGWTFGLIRTILTLFQIPFAIILAGVLCAYGIEYSTVLIRGSLCGLPVVSSYIAVCKFVPPPSAGHPPILDSLDYSSKLQELQKFGADNQEMIYALTIGEGDVRKMIFQLSITDAPSRAKLRPLYEDYKQLSGDTIDGLQDWLTQLDQIVKNTIIITSWTEDELLRIQDKQSSILAPVKNLISSITFQPNSVALLEVDVKKTFLRMTDQVSEKVVLSLLQAQRVRGNLIEMKATMESLAMIYLEDKEKIDNRRLSEKSFWRRILKPHRDKMANFEKTVDMCARFYNMTEYTIEKNRMVELKMISIRSQLKAFQDNLSLSNLWLESDMPLAPYLQMLSGSVKTLEISDREAKKQKAEVMKRIDATIRQ